MIFFVSSLPDCHSFNGISLHRSTLRFSVDLFFSSSDAPPHPTISHLLVYSFPLPKPVSFFLQLRLRNCTATAVSTPLFRLLKVGDDLPFGCRKFPDSSLGLSYFPKYTFFGETPIKLVNVTHLFPPSS